ncbi:MAG: alcohol dehydrogenase [Novosphingobium sp.]|nr:alcohol dehydrogenase [Novosphingobium sp.]
MTSSTWTYIPLERVLIGVNAGPALRAEAERLEKSRVFILTSGSVSRSPYMETVIEALGDRFAGLFDGIRPHDYAEDILAAAAAARAAGADLIAAVGGGSAIDAAKVVPILLRHDITTFEQMRPFRGLGHVPEPSQRPADEALWVRMIAIPTTLSAGEFTWWGGVLEPGTGQKRPYAHPMGMARTIILDPRAAMSAPLALFLSTGMKAVDHSAERLTSARRDELSDARSIHSLKLLARGLRRAHANPDEPAARQECQTGMAIGMASPLTGVGVGASHALGHALGGFNGVQHGLTSCALLPAVMRWNHAYNADRQELISEAMGRPGVPAGEVIEELIRDLGLPWRLRDVGASRDDFPEIAERVLTDHSIGANIRKPKDAGEIVALLEMAW